MKIFIYQTAELAPFEGLFEPLGSYQKVILSNHTSQVALFNRHSGLLIKELFPDESLEPDDETKVSMLSNEDSIFFIPQAMKDTLKKLLTNIFPKITWRENPTTTKLSKAELGLIGNEELSLFYDNLETQAVLQPALQPQTHPLLEDDETMSKKPEMEKLLNSITEQDNEIDAVLICIHDDNKTRIAYSSSPKTGTRAVDTDSFAVHIQHFIAMLKMTNKVNDKIGDLKTAEFLYVNGIVHITHLPQFGEHTFLVFVSATEEGIELLALHRKRNLDKIIELLRDLFG
jgi:hypothetical protein